jgi:dolichol-phosphate mannosyltransferase
MPLDAGDFSLLTMRVVTQINSLPEESRYVRGLRSWVGYKQAGIEYERGERLEGKSKYSLAALLKLAFNGIFNLVSFLFDLLSLPELFLLAFHWYTWQLPCIKN